ncbi:hypothetical protein AGMMS50229_17430 [Campylobacterota bacterium]|nr:hypothetical protein AGMMS50229_17430 [Campylobacterota bacterium]
MRVSTSAIYNSFIYNQQRGLSNLLAVNNQIVTGLKINFGYEDSTIYQDALRLINEKATLAQVSDNVQKAKTYSDNTDVAIASMKERLETFKVKLVQAANDVHSATSYAALASDLQALMLNIRDVGNTSINGNFLFSGTNMKQKPFDDNGIYYGNDQQIKAQAGDRLELAYNTDGWNLMQGMDSDYSKRITTDIQLFNMTKMHHRVMSVDDPMGLDTPVPITASDSIRDLIGQPDDSQSTYFYLRGAKPDGEGFKARVEMTNGATVQDLLDRIGREMGNTSIYKAVDVSLNALGHIEIKDVKSGRMLTDLHMVASDTKVDDISILGEAPNAHIYSFNKSGYGYARTQDSVSTAQDPFDQRVFTLNTVLRRQDNEALATKYDSLQAVLGKNVDEVNLDINGTTHTFAVNNLTTVQMLMDEVETVLESELGGNFDIGLQNGQIAIYDNNATGPQTPPELKVPSLLSGVVITAVNTAGEKVLAFSAADAVGYDRARFVKAGATMTSPISQIVRADSSFAVAATELKATSRSESMDEKRLHMEINDINGDRKLIEITLRDVPDASGRLSTYQIIEPDPAGEIYDIYDPSGNPTTASGYKSQVQTPYSDGLEVRTEDRKGFTYQQLMNIMAIAISNTEAASGSFDDYNRALASANQSVSVSMNNIGQIVAKDYTTSESKIQISLFDADTDLFDAQDLVSDKQLLQSFTGTKGEPGWSVKEDRPNRPLSEVFGFSFTGNLVLSGTDMYGNAAQTTLTQNSTLAELQAAIDGTFGDGIGNGAFLTEVIDGRLITRDNLSATESPVQINFLFQDAITEIRTNKSPSWTFSANNALTIDEPRLNVFDQLQEAIEAVRMGMTRPDGNNTLQTRNIGIQNAIYLVDHMLDHFSRMHTNNGAVGTALELTYEKSEMMILNVKTLKSMVLDADIGEAVVKMNQLSVSYQGLLSTLSRIHSMSLVNFLK